MTTLNQEKLKKKKQRKKCNISVYWKCITNFITSIYIYSASNIISDSIKKL